MEKSKDLEFTLQARVVVIKHLIAKAAVQSKFPDQKVYTTYQAPLFKVRVGDFIKREDAEKYRKSMLAIFPTGMYVVEDVVEAVLEDTYQ